MDGNKIFYLISFTVIHTPMYHVDLRCELKSWVDGMSTGFL